MRISVTSCLILILAGCASHPATEKTQQQSAIQNTAREIITLEAKTPDELQAASKSTPDLVVRIKAGIETLKSQLKTIADPELAATVHLDIAHGDAIINTLNLVEHKEADKPVAADAAAHYEAVIAYGRSVQRPNFILANVYYQAGSNAFMFAGDHRAALDYWKVCADMGHAGCMNNEANELLQRPRPTDLELAWAFDLLTKIVNTGVTFQCAATYSAVTNAYLAHFHLVARPVGEEFTLLDSARQNLKLMSQKTGTQNPCNNRANRDISEYLMRADKGDKRPALLDDAAAATSDPETTATLSYIKGAMTDAELDSALASMKASALDRCEAEFFRLWKSVEDKRRKVAARSYSELGKLGQTDCNQGFLYGPKLIARVGKPATTNAAN